MARFRFDWTNLRVHATTHVAVSERSLRALDLGGAEERQAGPGWFESSWELGRGLEVREGWPADARRHDWLAAQFAGIATARFTAAAPASRGGSVRSRSALAERDEQPRAGLVPAPADGPLVDTLQLCDLQFAVAAEVAHLDQFSQFGIDGLQLA